MLAPSSICSSFGSIVVDGLFGGPNATLPAVAEREVTPVSSAATCVDIGERITRLVGAAGAVHHSMGGFRIRVKQAATFPFAPVLTALLGRGFKVDVVSRQSDLLIEARP